MKLQYEGSYCSSIKLSVPFIKPETLPFPLQKQPFADVYKKDFLRIFYNLQENICIRVSI